MHQILILEESTRSKYWSDKKMMNSYSRLQMVQQNFQEETTNSENPLQGGNQCVRSDESTWIISRRIGRVSSGRTNRWRWSPCRRGRSKVISFIVITMNLEFNSTCRRKKHSLFRWSTLMSHGLLIPIWTSCKKTLECRFEQTLGEICPQKEKPPMVYMWSGRRLTKTQTTTRPDKFSSEVWTKIGKSRSESRETGMGNGKTWVPQCSKTVRNLFYWSRRQRTFGNTQKWEERTGKTNGTRHAVQENSV